MADEKKKFAFDREKDAVVPTRKFDHGIIHGEKGVPLTPAQVADLSDDAVKHLVEVAEVAEIKKGKADNAPAGDADKGATKP